MGGYVSVSLERVPKTLHVRLRSSTANSVERSHHTNKFVSVTPYIQQVRLGPMDGPWGTALALWMPSPAF